MAVCVALAATFALVAGVGAQQAGQNVPVLPVIQPGVADAHLKGDLYMQRQLEPTLAVSTRNPNHLIAFFNDYRAVDIPSDTGVGGGMFARVGTLVKTMWAKLLGRPTGRPALPHAAAAAEAWVGMSQSDDGGLTWRGGFVPGSPFDNSPASLASPVKGLEAASDPVAFAAPCGYVHLAFIAFTRGGSSKMVVATYQDLNASEGGESFYYWGTSVVEVGENATNGHFVDKPSIGVDVARDGSGGACGHSIYLGYSTFVGLQKNGKIQTQVTIAKSTDNGQTFTNVKLNQTWNESQGTAIAVDPRPTAEGGGAVYVAWRHFNSPDTIVVSKSTDFGVTFSKGEAVPSAPIEAFDQPSFSTAYGAENVAFRSNAFPTLAVADNGKVFVAWQERVSLTAGDGFALPASGGSPRIVLMRSDDGGGTWKGPEGTPGQQRAVDFGDRDADPASWPAPGLGLLPQSRPSGPQVMPKLTFGGGRLYLSYYESRGLLGLADTIIPADTTGQTPGYITGIDRVMDVRGALLDPATGALLNGTATSQISRYPVRADLGILGRPERLGDIEPVNAPCSPDYPGPGLPACVRRVNRVGAPHSAGGTTPFIGDYIDATPIVTFVPDLSTGGWKWANLETDVPYRAFRSIWADNRNLVPPPGGLAGYQNYSPPGMGVPCINPGSRNSDVFTSHVNADLVVSAPTTFTKTGAIQHAYPVFVQNTLAVNRYLRFAIETGADIASFDQYASDDPGRNPHVIQNVIYAFSSFTAVVYVGPGATGTVKVNVQELACASDDPATPVIEGDCSVSGSGGTATINLDPNQAVPFDVETHNPLVPNPLVPNPLVPNPLVPNPLVPNPLVPNPLVPNPLVPNPLVPNITASNSVLQDPATTIYNVQYATTSVTNGGNTTTVFTPDVKIDNPSQYDGEYVFQLVVYKTSASAGVQASMPGGPPVDPCATSNVPGFQILASVPMTSDMLNPLVPNPLVPNPLVPNPLVPNPLVPNPLVPNATITIAPSDPASGASNGALRSTAAATTQSADDGTLRAPKRQDEVHVALFAYQVVPNPRNVFNPNPPANGGDPPSIKVHSVSCNAGTNELNPCPSVYNAPDLVVTGTPELSSTRLVPGGSITITQLLLMNKGNAAAGSENLNKSYSHSAYLSDDDVWDGGDLDVGVLATSTGVLEAGATWTFGNITVSIPADASPRQKYLLIFVDAQREVSEVDEANNVVAIPVTIPAPTTTTVTCGAGPFTYTGAALTPCTATVTGADGFELTPTPAYVNNVNAGTATASYTYPGDDNHLGSVGSATFTIDRAVSVTTVMCPLSVTYTGTALTPCTAVVTGAGGLSQAVMPVIYANNTNVGPATASATFGGDANHLGSSDSKTFGIVMPPPPSVTVTATPDKLLWSPNKLMVPVTVSGTATGAGVTLTSCTVVDEYRQIQPLCNPVLSNGGYSFVINLEAYRNGSDADGRLYTITVTAKDALNQGTSAVTYVRVPHDQK